ncbi:MAG TPA: hypothetical protein VKW04_12600 [Planctomycetota bacterium]|jgi:hypothetical protein|nr:hypothetical protein [Planctomycetota bacterium]
MHPESVPEDVEIQDRGRYLEVRYLGDFSVERFNRQTDASVHACVEKKKPLLLIDVTGMIQVPSLVERFEIAIHGARVGAGLRRIALLARAELIDPGKFGVQVARNRGLSTDVFTERPKALAWLLAPKGE